MCSIWSPRMMRHTSHTKRLVSHILRSMSSSTLLNAYRIVSQFPHFRWGLWQTWNIHKFCPWRSTRNESQRGWGCVVMVTTRLCPPWPTQLLGNVLPRLCGMTLQWQCGGVSSCCNMTCAVSMSCCSFGAVNGPACRGTTFQSLFSQRRRNVHKQSSYEQKRRSWNITVE
jgi:hypothetical protein